MISPTDSLVRVWINWIPADHIVVPFTIELAKACVKQELKDKEPCFVMREQDWMWLCLRWPHETAWARVQPYDEPLANAWSR